MKLRIDEKFETHLVTTENFHEISYLVSNPDVAIAVIDGRVESAFAHFLEYGQREARRQIIPSQSDLELERSRLPASVPLSQIANHSNIKKLAQKLGCVEGVKFLEVGSRNVTGPSQIRNSIELAGGSYVGFDFYEGENVDVVGDAHKLSDYFDYKFDVVYSSAVFEHLAMPWVVATEIAKIMNVNASILVETHFSYSSHERPWHFFQFSDMGLRTLFSPALGFRCIEAGMCNPMVGKFSALADEYLRRKRINGLFCHSNLYAVKERDVPNFEWGSAGLQDIVGDTVYPAPKV
jgi:2-polyprenyl-3-methyl-5-hydroxy-6-metoxy-1,4-benzoquinol methylase